MTLEVACEPFLDITEVDCDCDKLAPEVVQELIDSASDIIAILTGGKITGRCTTTVHPTIDKACSPVKRDYQQLPLPGTEIFIDAVRVDGTLLDPTEYAILDERFLVRRSASWPGNRDPLNLDTGPNSFSVTFTNGSLPHLAKRAAREIVCDMVKTEPGSAKAQQLDPRARQVTVAGVSISLEQQVEEIRRRSIFLPSLIRLLTVYAPDSGQPSVVYSPELDNGWVLHTVS